MSLIFEQNQKLLRERCEVRETVSVSPSVITRVTVEGKDTNRFRIGIVGEADALNQNKRVYPKSEWEKQISRANDEMIPNGTLIGAVDHQGCAEGGNLKNSPIIWRGLSLDSNSRLVVGEFDVIEGHSAGKDLLAQIEAGVTIGFSTVGYATAREPNKDERGKYGIAEKDEDAVIIENWELVKIDAVDNPSVRSARMVKQSAGTPAHEGDTVTIKTIEELKAQHKELLESSKVELVTVESLDAAKKIADDAKALADKVAALETKVAELEPIKAKYDAIIKKLSDSLTCLADEHGVERPYKEVTQKEADEKIQKLSADLEAANAAKAEAEKSAREAQAKLDAIAAEKADRERQETVAAKVAELTAASKFAKAIVKAAAEAAKTDKTLTAETIKAFVDAKTAEYDAIEVAPADPKFDIAGILHVEPKNEGKSMTAAEELAKSL